MVFAREFLKLGISVYHLFFQTIRGCDVHFRAFLLSVRRMEWAGWYGGKLGLVPPLRFSRTAKMLANNLDQRKPGKLPHWSSIRTQIERHHDRIFRRIGIVIRTLRNGPKTTLLIQRLGRRVSVADLEKSRCCTLSTRFVEHASEQHGAVTTPPKLCPDSNVVDV